MQSSATATTTTTRRIPPKNHLLTHPPPPQQHNPIAATPPHRSNTTHPDDTADLVVEGAGLGLAEHVAEDDVDELQPRGRLLLRNRIPGEPIRVEFLHARRQIGGTSEMVPERELGW